MTTTAPVDPAHARPTRELDDAPADLAAWQPGQVAAGRYRLLSDRRQEGAWEVVDQHLHRRCAIYPLPPGILLTPEGRARLTALGRLAHPNLAGVWNLVPERPPTPALLVTQRPTGVQIARLLPAAGLGRHLALPIVAQVASALATAHDAGIHHGRLDAWQIWVEPTGSALVTQVGLHEFAGGHASAADDLEALRRVVMPMARHELAAAQFAWLFEGHDSARTVEQRALLLLESIQPPD